MSQSSGFGALLVSILAALALSSTAFAGGSGPDCNTNFISDDFDILMGTSADCNTNQTPDECDVGLSGFPDCNTNGTPDECEPDSDQDGVPDDCDLCPGYPDSEDCNTNGVPDFCDAYGPADCNTNGTADICDDDDCDLNGTLDMCEIAAGGADCNTNGVVDACETTAGFGFAFSQEIDLGATYPLISTTADFDRDGNADVAMTTGIDDFVAVFYGDGSGGLFGPVYYMASPDQYSLWGIDVADFNGDQYPDLVVTLYDFGVAVLLNDGAGGFLSPVSYPSDPGGAFANHSVYYPVAARLDADAHVDIAAVDYRNNLLCVFLNNGDGTFADVQVTVIVPGTDNAYPIDDGDIDGDGDVDLLIGLYTTGRVAILRNDGQANFTPGAQLGLPTHVEYVHVADLDGDGDPDIVGLTYDPLGVHVFRNNGAGLFVPVSAVIIDPNPFSYSETVHSADFDGDGDLDLALVSYEQGRAYILRNSGIAQFTIAGSFPLRGFDAYDSIPADLNGDGLADLVVPTINRVEVHINSSAGSSDCNTNGVPDECDAASGASADCNNNGLPDECDVVPGGGDTPVPVPFSFEYPVFNDSASCDDCELGEVNLPWTVTVDGVPLARFVQSSNGYVELMMAGEDGCFPSYGDLSDITSCSDTTDHTYLLAAYDDLDSGDCCEFGYQVLTDRAIFYWNTETYDDGGDGQPNEFEVILYADGRILWNFAAAQYDSYDYDLLTGVYYGYGRDEFVEVARDRIPSFESFALGGVPSSTDCNSNGTPDECELSQDCNTNGTADSCEQDSDGDGVTDACDRCPGVEDGNDSDNDGVPDGCDRCPTDPLKVHPGACGCDVPDDDDDNDGVPNCFDICPGADDRLDSDSDGIPDCHDPCPLAGDSDGDGVDDCLDRCPDDPNKLDPGACGCGVPDTDANNDGVPDCVGVDLCPSDPNKLNPGICGCGVPDDDTDGDGLPDCIDPCPTSGDSDGDGVDDCLDRCPNDPAKLDPGACGCGVPDTDADGDGLPDCLSVDLCPNDPNKVAPGACGCGVPDVDADGDGVPDCFSIDLCPDDPNKTNPGVCGCGVPDTDADGNGVPDCLDVDLCPNDPNKTSPGACGCGVPDTDADGDGVPDCFAVDLCPNDPNKTNPGICGCGVPDVDSDGDGVPDCIDRCPNDPNKIDAGACGCGSADIDSDGDGILNCFDNCPTTPNPDQADADNDGVGDACEQAGPPPGQETPTVIDRDLLRMLIDLLFGNCGAGLSLALTGSLAGLVGMKRSVRRRRS